MKGSTMDSILAEHPTVTATRARGSPSPIAGPSGLSLEIMESYGPPSHGNQPLRCQFVQLIAIRVPQPAGSPTSTSERQKDKDSEIVSQRATGEPDCA